LFAHLFNFFLNPLCTSLFIQLQQRIETCTHKHFSTTITYLHRVPTSYNHPFICFTSTKMSKLNSKIQRWEYKITHIKFCLSYKNLEITTPLIQQPQITSFSLHLLPPLLLFFNCFLATYFATQFWGLHSSLTLSQNNKSKKKISSVILLKHLYQVYVLHNPQMVNDKSISRILVWNLKYMENFKMPWITLGLDVCNGIMLYKQRTSCI